MAIAVDKPRQLMKLAMMTVAVMTVTVGDCDKVCKATHRSRAKKY